MSPQLLASHAIPVVKVVHNPREFVVVFPGAYHRWAGGRAGGQLVGRRRQHSLGGTGALQPASQPAPSWPSSLASLLMLLSACLPACPAAPMCLPCARPAAPMCLPCACHLQRLQPRL